MTSSRERKKLRDSRDLAPILDEVVDSRFKGFPSTTAPVTIGAVAEQGWHALDGDLIFPLLLLKQRALCHNINTMAQYCREHGVSLAPHGKTPLSPQIARMQLDAGAWGITVSNVHHARVFRDHGVSRLLMANQLLDRAAISWVARELAGDPDFRFYCLVDSLAGVTILEEVLEEVGPSRPLSVLVEVGVHRGRSGCRTVDEAWTVARAVRGAPHLQLAGIEGYEGAISASTLGERLASVDRYLQTIVTLARDWFRCQLFEESQEFIITAGGSLFFDRVVDILGDLRNCGAHVVLRSGSYITHDLDTYEQLSPLAERGNSVDRLLPALELWGMILSTPEPGLAIAGFGKRDAAYDIALPTPFVLRRRGVFTDILTRVQVTALNDQHAFLEIERGCDVAVGDSIGCHISHPCTSFDKWHLVPLVDDHYRVVGAIRTFF